MTALPLPAAARSHRRTASARGLAARAGGLAAGVTQIGGRIGVRLALLQAVILVTAFALAGYVGRLSITAIAEAAVREQVAGEAASMRAEYVQKGAAPLPHPIDKRTRLWRGFEYRLTAGDGRDLLSARHLRELVPDLDAREVYLCGPPAMTAAVARPG